MGANANKIATIRAMPEVRPHLDVVIIEALGRLSYVLSPTMNESARMNLIKTAHDNIIRKFGKRFSLTALIHCFDMIINAQPPFEREIMRFDIRAINGFLHKYLMEQAEKVQADEDKPLGAAQREYLLAKALAKNPEASKALRDLAHKLELKHGDPELKAQREKAKGPQFVNIADYLFRKGFDPDQVQLSIWDYCKDNSLDYDDELMKALNEINALGQSELINIVTQQTQS